MQDEDYRRLLISHRINVKRPALNTYFHAMYSRLSLHLPSRGRILEVGAGAGISSFFITTGNVDRTDMLAFPDGGVIGNIDCHKLPYPNQMYEAVIGVDVLHHLVDPLRAVSEFARVLKPGGKMVFVEPYVSFFSYLPFVLFHSEKTSLPLLGRKNRRRVTEVAWDGDQAQVQMALLSHAGIKELHSSLAPLRFVLHYETFSCLSFFATGGLARPLPVPKSFIQFLLFLESYIPQQIMKRIASRVLVLIELDEQER